MRRTGTTAIVAVSAVAALVLTACNSSNKKSSSPTSSASAGSSSSSSAQGGGTAGFNAGVGKVFNASTQKGGTVTMANGGDWDSLDPADMYYAYEWDFVRLYGRSLLVFKAAPGSAGTKLVPDLATGLGVASDNAKTWTYHIRPGVKFEDGTVITSKDVKYAVERSLDKDVFPDGPTYFNDQLDLQGYTSSLQGHRPRQAGPEGDRHS